MSFAPAAPGSPPLSISRPLRAPPSLASTTNRSLLPLRSPPNQASNFVAVQLYHDTNAQGNTTVTLQLTNAYNGLLFSPSRAILTIVDVDRLPGQLFFAQTNLFVSEGAAFANLTVLRTNGHFGIVTVDYATFPISAIPGTNYIATNNSLSFADGETSKTISVPILQEHNIEPGGSSSFTVALSNPGSGAALLDPTNATVNIIDDDVSLQFSLPFYAVDENAGGVVLTVERQGTNGYTTVSYITTNGTAFAGTNFDGLTNTLAFQPGEFRKTFPITIRPDPHVTGDLAFNVTLFNAFDPSNPTNLVHFGANNPTTVTINDLDPGIAFATNNFFVLKSATNVLITVVRSNVNTGTLSVSWATTNNGTASPGIDYTTSGGPLTFTNGDPFQTFTVPINNNGLFQGNRTFEVYLFTNAQSGIAQLLPPTRATVTIIDDVAGISFSQAGFSAPENAGPAMISIVRSGYSNSTVAVDFATDGNLTPYAAGNYLPTSLHLVFRPGQMVTNVPVYLFDNSILVGDQMVQLSLSNATPVGRAVLLDPLSVPLTILEADGSFIRPAGVDLTDESGPVNGIIDPGERVSLRFALRNAAGTNTVNLFSTLLVTNGVSNPSGPQNYGALVVQGPSASRSFSFTANGTNGQAIAATFFLQDGAFTNQVVFPFTLGQSTATFSNTALINIIDHTNASPYPSTIEVNGLGGVLTKATVTLTNFNHTWPRDVDVLLVSPTGHKSYLMAKSGSTLAANGRHPHLR